MLDSDGTSKFGNTPPLSAPSPIATAGAGGEFEDRVAAFVLLLLLAQSRAPILVDAIVRLVHFQARHLGWRTDDILIEADTALSTRRRLAIQVKRTFVVSASNDECAKTLAAMWDDFRSTDRFDPSNDRLAIAVALGTKPILHDFAGLLDCARAAIDESDFLHRLSLRSYLSTRAKGQYAAVASILRSHSSEGVSDNDVWQFLRVVHVLSYDFGTSTAQGELLTKSLLAHIYSGDDDPQTAANNSWNELVVEAGNVRPTAKSFQRSDLPASILAGHRQLVAGDVRALLDLSKHGESVLNELHGSINPNLKFARTELVSEFMDAVQQSPITAVIGDAGSGKSGLIKNAIEVLAKSHPVIAFQAVELASPHLDTSLHTISPNLNVRTVETLLAASGPALIVIDGFERLLEHSQRDGFAHLVRLVTSSKSLKLVITCRSYAWQTAKATLFGRGLPTPKVVEVPNLTEDELDEAAQAFPGLTLAMRSKEFRNLVRTPYLVWVASQLDWSNAPVPTTLSAFRKRCWTDLIRFDSRRIGGMPARRERMFVQVAMQRAAQLRRFVALEQVDDEALDSLIASSLLHTSPDSSNMFAPSHDVLEDWAVQFHLGEVFAKTADDLAVGLMEEVKGLPALRRSLRYCLQTRLESHPVDTCELLLSVVASDDLPKYFEDDCIVAALQSTFAQTFAEACQVRIRSGDKALLRRVILLLRVTCKAKPQWAPDGPLPSLLWQATGQAWVPILAIVADEAESLSDSDPAVILGLVEDWSQQDASDLSKTQGAISAGKILSALVRRYDGTFSGEFRDRILKLVLKLPSVTAAFDELSQRAGSGNRRDSLGRDFSDLACSNVASMDIARDTPDFVATLVRSKFAKRLRNHTRASGLHEERDLHFGIVDSGHQQFYPASAIQGPFRSLFIHHESAAEELVIELANHCANWYATDRATGGAQSQVQKIELDVPDHGLVELWIDPHLFSMYRGIASGPDLLESALMALESSLLDRVKDEQVDIDSVLLNILARSNNAMIAGIVASICILHPQRTLRTLLLLLSSREIIECDRYRRSGEDSANSAMMNGMVTKWAPAEAERKKSNKLPHRGASLEEAAFYLQQTPARESVWSIIDKHRESISGATTPDLTAWRMSLHRMDLRGYKDVDAPATVSPVDGPSRYMAPADIEQDLLDRATQSRTQLELMSSQLSFAHQAKDFWENDSAKDDSTFQLLLERARAVAESGNLEQTYQQDAPGLIAAAAIRYGFTKLSADDLQWCIERIEHELFAPTSVRPQFGPTTSEASKAAANVVVMLCVRCKEFGIALPERLLTRSLAHANGELRSSVYMGATALLDSNDPVRLYLGAVAATDALVRIQAKSEGKRVGKFGWREPTDVEHRLTVAIESLEALDDQALWQRINEVRFQSFEGRQAVLRILRLLRQWMSAPALKVLLASALDDLALRWRRSARAGGVNDRDHGREQELSEFIADYVLNLPTQEAIGFLEPLLNLIETDPTEFDQFYQALVASARNNADDCFWSIWEEISHRVFGASWPAHLENKNNSTSAFVSHLLFAHQSHRQSWSRLSSQAERIHELAIKMPSSLPVTLSYLGFLQSGGCVVLPSALGSVAEMILRDATHKSLLNADLMLMLEQILGGFVYAIPAQLRASAKLRTAILGLLDAMTDAGSTAAYCMRDDFVTPYSVK